MFVSHRYFCRQKQDFHAVSSELAKKEADMIIKEQLDDGSFPILWQWYNDYKEFEISANWWKSDIIIKNILYLKYLKNLTVQLFVRCNCAELT